MATTKGVAYVIPPDVSATSSEGLVRQNETRLVFRVRGWKVV